MASINRAQALALREGFLDDIGATRAGSSDMPIVEAILGKAGQALIDTAVANLDKSASVSKGGLASALELRVDFSGGTYVLSVGYEKGSPEAKYYDFNNKGIGGVTAPGKGVGSPYKFRYLGVSKSHALAILKWIRHNGKSAANIHPSHPVSGLERKRVGIRQSIAKTDSAKSLAYAMAYASKRDGIKGSHYFDNAVSTTLGPELIDALQVALAGEVLVRIRQSGDKLL